MLEISAEEAKELTQRAERNKIPEQLNKILAEVEQEALKGEGSIIYRDTIYPENILKLDKLGYRIMPDLDNKKWTWIRW